MIVPPAAGMLLLLMLGTSPAFGWSISLSAPQVTYYNDVISITTSGYADESPAWASLFGEPRAADCAKSSGDEQARVAADKIGERIPRAPNQGAGPFSFINQWRARSSQVDVSKTGATFRLCAYLYDPYTDNTQVDPPRALATATVKVLPRPVAPRMSGENTQRAGPTVVVRAACNQACQLTATGVIGGKRLYRAGPLAGGKTPKTLKLKLSTGELKSLRAYLKTHDTATVSGTVTAGYPLGRSRHSAWKVTLTP